MELAVGIHAKSRRFYIIDGHSQIFRAVYTKGPSLISSDGEPTRGTYYFCRMLMKLVREQKPTYLAIAMDTPRHLLWRRELEPLYKANRDTSDKGRVDLGYPAEVVVQIQRIKQILELLGVPMVSFPKWEADDVIATLAYRARAKAALFDKGPPIEVVMVSRDKDLHQLIGKRCFMYDPQAEEWTYRADVVQRWGVRPDQVVDVQALMGDPTDNVVGVRGIGPKKAKELIASYGSIQGLLETQGEDLSDSLWAKIEGTDLHKQRQLVMLNKELDIKFKLDDYLYTGLDTRAAQPVFRALGFQRWS